MRNLLGCTKENFLKLLNLMNYKYKKIDNAIILKYLPKKATKIIKNKNSQKFDNPFKVPLAVARPCSPPPIMTICLSSTI